MDIEKIIRMSPLTILGAVIGALVGSWEGAFLGGLVGFILDNIFGKMH